MFKYERRPVWDPTLKLWDDEVIAVEGRTKTLVWLRKGVSGGYGCHVLVDKLFAWFLIHGDPIHVEEAYRADYEKQKREGWSVSSVRMTIWNPINGSCPISTSKLQFRDALFALKMMPASDQIADFIYPHAFPALAWWPDYEPLTGPIAPRVNARPIWKKTVRSDIK